MARKLMRTCGTDGATGLLLCTGLIPVFTLIFFEGLGPGTSCGLRRFGSTSGNAWRGLGGGRALTGTGSRTGAVGTLAGATAFFILIFGFMLGTILGAAAGLLCIGGTAALAGNDGGAIFAAGAGGLSTGALTSPPGDFLIAIRLTEGAGLEGGNFSLILLTGRATLAGCSG